MTTNTHEPGVIVRPQTASPINITAPDRPAPGRHAAGGRHAQPARAPLAVAQVIGRFTGGGAEHLALNLAQGVHSAGIRSFAVAVRSIDKQHAADRRGVDFIGLGADSGRPLAVARAALRLRRFIRRNRIDILHSHGHATVQFCSLATLGMRRRPRMVFTFHQPEKILVDRGLRLRFTRWVIRGCDRVYAPSREIASVLTRRAGLSTPVAVLRNGVAPIPQAGQSGGIPTIVWAARMTQTKDPHILLRAASRLRDEGHRFQIVLAGSTPPDHTWYDQEIRDHIARLRLGALVTLPGWVSDTASLFRSASIAVQTSHAEGLSLSLLEQMMAGLAIVATDVGDTSTAIVDGRTGILIPPRNDDALVAALRRLILDPDLRSRLGEAARQAALRYFTIEHMAHRAADEYRSLMHAG